MIHNDYSNSSVMVINLKTAKALGLRGGAHATRARRRGHRIGAILLQLLTAVLGTSRLSRDAPLESAKWARADIELGCCARHKMFPRSIALPNSRSGAASKWLPEPISRTRGNRR